jgi:hypothetical protein
VFYTGIDQHRRSSVLTTYTEEGQVVGHATLPNEPLRLRRYFAQFPGSHRAVVEATGLTIKRLHSARNDTNGASRRM